jgi:hypothetical protein
MTTRRRLMSVLSAAVALDREPSLRGARTEIELAQGLQQQARLRPNPTLTFERRGEPDGG